MNSRLNAIRNKRATAYAAKEKTDLPEYTLQGTVNNAGKKDRKALKVIGISLIGFLSVVCGVLYLPALFMQPEPASSPAFTVQIDTTVTDMPNAWTRESMNADFDNDKLINSLESEYGTSPRRIDTDNDGITDYAEIYVTDTDPAVPNRDICIDVAKKEAKAAGAQLGSPYKVHNVILWPETWEARTFGSVLPSLQGYVFCEFVGWAKFPESGIAYGYDGKEHFFLSYREAEDAWYIPHDCTVKIYGQELGTTIRLKTPFGESYLRETFFTNLIEKLLLDDHAWFAAKRIFNIDAWEQQEETTETKWYPVQIDKENKARFGASDDSLADLANVYKLIEEGYCVAASLYRTGVGEAFITIYGYDANGDLLVSEHQKERPLGKLTIKPACRRIMDADGVRVQYEWFEFSGLGFDSGQYDRINFLGY